MNRVWEIMCLMSSKVSSTLRFYSSKYNLNITKLLSSKKASLPESVTFITSSLNTTKSYREFKYLELGVQVEYHENLVKNEIPEPQVKTHPETIHTKIHAKQNKTKQMLIASLYPFAPFKANLGGRKQQAVSSHSRVPLWLSGNHQPVHHIQR